MLPEEAPKTDNYLTFNHTKKMLAELKEKNIYLAEMNELCRSQELKPIIQHCGNVYLINSNVNDDNNIKLNAFFSPEPLQFMLSPSHNKITYTGLFSIDNFIGEKNEKINESDKVLLFNGKPERKNLYTSNESDEKFKNQKHTFTLDDVYFKETDVIKLIEFWRVTGIIPPKKKELNEKIDKLKAELDQANRRIIELEQLAENLKNSTLNEVKVELEEPMLVAIKNVCKSENITASEYIAIAARKYFESKGLIATQIEQDKAIIADPEKQLAESKNYTNTPANTVNDVIQKLLDKNNDNYAPDLCHAVYLWLELYSTGEPLTDSHTNKSNQWIDKNTGYGDNAKTTKARIREITTPLKNWNGNRPKEK